jgi:YHS domain-containing protein
MRTVFCIMIGALALLSGCATSGGRLVAQGEETCQVCRYRNDLACICVKVDESTPRTEFAGKTYYFCSESCRETFLKKPEKYLPKP